MTRKDSEQESREAVNALRHRARPLSGVDSDRRCSRQRAKALSPTSRHLDVDVVIVGGGITGAICAYLFADAGVRVALVESKIVGHGSTVASTALLMQEPDRDFGDLAAAFRARGGA